VFFLRRVFGGKPKARRQASEERTKTWEVVHYGPVCSGIEAAKVAWHPLGWTPAFFSEVEKFPRAVLQHHYPDVPLHGEFTTIKGNEYGPIDLLVGGTPASHRVAPAREKDWMTLAATWPLNIFGLLTERAALGRLGKCSRRIVIEQRAGLWLLPRRAGRTPV